MRVAILLITITLLSACDTDIKPCNNNNDIEISEKQGILLFDNRFDQRIIRHHVPGTIDNFKIYIPCEINTDIEDNTTVTFSGFAAPLADNKKPDAQIGAEQFFTLSFN